MRFDLVIFDLDGTLIAHSEPIWKTLHRRLGSDPEQRRQLLSRGLSETISYEQWVAGDVDLLRQAGATRQGVAAIVAELTPTKGARELIDRLVEVGTKVAVVSGGIGLVVDLLLSDWPLDEVFVNRLRFDARGRLVSGEATPYDRGGKADALEVLARRYGTVRQRVAFVGDGDNDRAIMARAGYGIAWGPSAPSSLVALADCHVTSGDLSDLIPLLL